MKNSLFIILFLITISCSSQNTITYQEVLGDYISQQVYKTSTKPYLEFEHEENKYSVFWHLNRGRNILIFTENDSIFFAMNCGQLPVGERNIGNISFFSQSKFDELAGSKNFIVLDGDTKGNYNHESPELNTKIKHEKIIRDGYVPIEVELEIPFLFYKNRNNLLYLPLEE